MTPLISLCRLPVRLRLAGEDWHAKPLRIRDVAELAALAMATYRVPIVPDADPSTPEGRTAWLTAVEAAEAPVPDWGSGPCSAIALGTRPGRALMIAAVLRDHNLAFEDAEALAEQLTPDEWNEFDRVAFALDARAWVITQLDRALGTPPRDPDFIPPGRTLAEAVVEVAAELGLAPSDVAEWTLAEFSAFRLGGKASDIWAGPDAEHDPAGWQWFADEVQPRRAAFFKESAEVPREASPPSDPLPDPPAPGPTPTDPPRP